MMTGIHLIDEGTPEQAYGAGEASASALIRSLGEKIVKAFRDPNEQVRMRERALRGHASHWDQEGDLGREFLHGFDDTIRRWIHELGDRRDTGEPRFRILTPMLTDLEYRQLREASRVAEMSPHEYTAALIRVALREGSSGCSCRR